MHNVFFLSLSPSHTLFLSSILAIAQIGGREEGKIANIRQSIHQPHQMYWFGKFWTLKANDDNGYVFVCRIWCSSNTVPYFFRSVFSLHFLYFLSIAFVHFIAFFSHPKNVCRSILIFEWGQIVTLSLKDGFFGMRAYRKQLLVGCLFVYYLPNIFGFFLFLSLFHALPTEHPNRWPSFGVCICYMSPGYI